MIENKEKTNLDAYGEFGLIDLLTKEIKLKNKSSIMGVGDDAAIIDSGNRLQLVSTDLLVEGIHFDMHYTPLRHLGYKAIASNLSDIAAMNAKPEQVLVGIAVSSKYTVEAIEELYLGMRICCQRYGVDLVGGDTTSSAGGLFISVTVIGYASEEKIVKRSTANEHDLICVSGDLGSAYMGLLILEREKQVFLANPQALQVASAAANAVHMIGMPEARILLSEAAVYVAVSPKSNASYMAINKAQSLINSQETGEVPMHLRNAPIEEMGTILGYGKGYKYAHDYELLFTIRQDDYEKIKHSPDITVIGYITEKAEGCSLITKDDKLIELKAQGWNAFVKHTNDEKAE